MITAKIIKKSISPSGVILRTFELEYPRFIHQELLTHRVFSRNSASSRAIPISKMNEYVLSHKQYPIHWGKNQPGMQSFAEIDSKGGIRIWDKARDSAVQFSKELNDIGYHKQICNRLTEPFQTMKVILSTTEINNMFHLRLHETAQPEFQDLAKKMYISDANFDCEFIDYNEWHLPYVKTERQGKKIRYIDPISNKEFHDVKTAIMVSASACAQVSYRNLDLSLEKALKIHNMLVTSYPLHGSALEHCATPMKKSEWMVRRMASWMIKDDIALFKGNFKGWTQYRKLFANENNTKKFELEIDKSIDL